MGELAESEEQVPLLGEGGLISQTLASSSALRMGHEEITSCQEVCQTFIFKTQFPEDQITALEYKQTRKPLLVQPANKDA